MVKNPKIRNFWSEKQKFLISPNISIERVMQIHGFWPSLIISLEMSIFDLKMMIFNYFDHGCDHNLTIILVKNWQIDIVNVLYELS